MPVLSPAGWTLLGTSVPPQLGTSRDELHGNLNPVSGLTAIAIAAEETFLGRCCPKALKALTFSLLG